MPYHVRRVDSLDALYGGDPKFIAELDSLSGALLAQIVAHADTRAMLYADMLVVLSALAQASPLGMA